MKIKFLGAAGTVTGSSYMLTSQSGDSILIDCGMFQGTHEVDALNYSALTIDPSKLLGIVLTHAHLDHCGRLPFLVKSGFSQKIWMTPPTNDITNISLYDTARLGKNRGNGALYTSEDVDRTITLFTNVDYDTEFSIGPFRITFRDAGHIIGSASAEIIDTTATGEIKKIVFSGDLGNSPEPLIKPTEMIKSADCAVIESTYGDRLHPIDRPQDKLQLEINSIEVDGGVLLIPAFSIERSQEILHIISHLKKSGKVKNETEVVFDGPMGEKVTEVFEKYRGYYNQELTDDLKDSDPFKFPGLNEIHKYDASIEEQETGGPKVVIAGSGMMSGGRIVEYAAKFLPLPTTRILFVGYQAEGTLGRKILDGQKLVRIQGIETEVKATVNEVQALSSHADQNGLLNWLRNIQGLRKIFIGHGENPVRTIFSDKIKSDLKIDDVVIPNLNEEINF